MSPTVEPFRIVRLQLSSISRNLFPLSFVIGSLLAPGEDRQSVFYEGVIHNAGCSLGNQFSHPYFGEDSCVRVIVEDILSFL